MRILYVVKNLRIANGVSSYLMNYYRELKKYNITADFLIINDTDSPYYQEIEKNNDNVLIVPSYKKNVFKTIKFINQVLKQNQYDIVHCNVVNSGALVLLIARLNNVKVRIIHSHATQDGDSFFKKIRNIPFKKIALMNSNCYFACSKLAGEGLFGNKNFNIINNAIDIKKFQFNEDIRKKITEEYNHNKDKIILVVGRITKQKNPYFIVDIMKELSKKSDEYTMWWLGNGDMDEEIKKYIDKNGLNEKIVLFGSVKNVNEFYSAADIFILPSFYEGLPVVGIEAQINGLFSLFSENITREASLGEKCCEFLPIDNPDVWATRIINNSTTRKDVIDSCHFDEYLIDKQANKLYDLYKKELSEKK